jgi:uncharacterized membrane protein
VRVFLTGRWVGWALLASLAANLFLGGLIGMRAWHEHGESGMARLGPMGPVVGALPASGRDKVRAAMKARDSDLRQHGREFRRARAEAERLLAADPYDQARAQAAFAEARQRADALASVVQGALIEAGARLSPEERKALRDRMAERERDRERRGPPPR